MTAVPAILLPLWFVFVSTAVSVLQRNSEEFYATPGLLQSNVLTFGAAATAALVTLWLLGAARAGILLSLPLSLAAFAAIALKGHASAGAAAGLTAVVIAAGFAVARRLGPDRVREFAAICFALLAAYDIVTVARLSRRTRVTPDGVAAPWPANGPRRPNVYHFLFDAYQADVFEELVDREGSRDFDGFTFFRRTAPVFPNTVDSLATLFAWQEADEAFAEPGAPHVRRAAFHEEAHAGARSLKQRLKRLGYRTAGHSYYSSHIPHLADGFDVFAPHIQYVETPPASLNDRRLFFNLWLLSVLPRRAASLFVSNVVIERLLSRQTLSRFPSLVSYAAAERFLGEEYRKPDHSRYTFFHVLLPHKPFVMTPACGARDEDLGDSPPPPRVEDQYRCALRLMGDIIRTLKALGRFENAMVVFQSDHGDGIARDASGNYRRGEPPSPATMSRALLLVKWPGETTPLHRSDVPARTSDVTRTILAAVGDNGAGVKGLDLRRAEGAPPRPVRYFFLEREDHTERFAIDASGRLQPAGTVPNW